MRSTRMLMVLALAAGAQARQFGAGVMIGEPTGLCGKIMLDRTHAVDFGVAWSLSRHQSLHVHGDYLFHHALSGSGLPGRLDLHYGLGGRLQVRDEDEHGRDGDDQLGVRIPVGLDWKVPSAPLDFLLELAPVVDLVPDTDADLEGGIGLRFWF